MSLPKIAIALGDPAGIGPEIALKAALDARLRRVCRPVLVGDPRVVATHAALCGLAPRLAAAHGSALDLAGKNRASPEAMVEAVRRLAGVPAEPPR